MARCSMCGRFYIFATGQIVTRPMVAQGTNVQTEFPDGKCSDCCSPGEEVTLVYVGSDDLYGQFPDRADD